jgi:hypothetical protein
MQVQPVDSLFVSNPYVTTHSSHDSAQELTEGGQKGLPARPVKNVHLTAQLEAESFVDQKIAMEFTSKDGDKVTFSMESLQYRKTMLQVDAEGSPEDMQKIVDYIKKEYTSMREELQKAFIKSIGGSVDDTSSIDEAGKTDTLNIPEYWNAENTSQRIVDFAVSFFNAFKGSGEEFLNIIKGAIEKGFGEAADMLGDLPDAVQGLVNDTHRLVMEKLDAWAQSQGIAVDTAGTTETLKAAA